MFSRIWEALVRIQLVTRPKVIYPSYNSGNSSTTQRLATATSVGTRGEGILLGALPNQQHIIAYITQTRNLNLIWNESSDSWDINLGPMSATVVPCGVVAPVTEGFYPWGAWFQLKILLVLSVSSKGAFHNDKHNIPCLRVGYWIRIRNKFFITLRYNSLIELKALACCL